jgi:gamma-glutamylcyclotransferase (GGCT)/AIG2-like uncharacterized protein YtfP
MAHHVVSYNFNRQTDIYPLFVYGTLKRGEINYLPYLGGRTTHEQPATLSGAVLYTEGQYPFLVLGAGLAADTDQVRGMLMTIHPAFYDEVMRHVDELEDYKPGDPANWYERTLQTVQTTRGPVEAWVYIAGQQVLQAIQRGHFARITGSTWGKMISM